MLTGRGSSATTWPNISAENGLPFYLQLYNMCSDKILHGFLPWREFRAFLSQLFFFWRAVGIIPVLVSSKRFPAERKL